MMEQQSQQGCLLLALSVSWEGCGGRDSRGGVKSFWRKRPAESCPPEASGGGRMICCAGECSGGWGALTPPAGTRALASTHVAEPSGSPSSATVYTISLHSGPLLLLL